MLYQPPTHCSGRPRAKPSPMKRRPRADRRRRSQPHGRSNGAAQTQLFLRTPRARTRQGGKACREGRGQARTARTRPRRRRWPAPRRPCRFRSSLKAKSMQTATIFNHETVPLDGEAFSDCEFRGCRLVYSGGEPPKFDRCRFDESAPGASTRRRRAHRGAHEGGVGGRRQGPGASPDQDHHLGQLASTSASGPPAPWRSRPGGAADRIHPARDHRRSPKWGCRFLCVP